MKFVPIDNKPNVSLSRFDSVSTSMKLDSRGYPCISWLDKKNGYNEICYKYWDGFDWRYYNKPNFKRSSSNVNYAPSSLVLGLDEKPNIAYCKKDSSGNNILVVATVEGGAWTSDEFQVNYEVLWIGIHRWDRNIYFSSSSSSSSSSIDSSSSSSSRDSSSSSSIDSNSSSSIGYSSSSSSSSSFSSSSSSSKDSSSSSSKDSSSSVSSSSIDSSSSSSSSSMEDNIYFIVTYDSQDVIRIYAKSTTWRLLTSFTESISDVSTLKIKTCGKRIGFVYNDTNIKYNFFDLDSEAWTMASFKTLASVPAGSQIITTAIDGYNIEDSGIMALAFIASTSNSSSLYRCSVTDLGVENCEIVEEKISTITTSTGFILNGYRALGICVDEDLYSRIFASGAQSALFKYNGIIWTKTDIDIDGGCLPIIPTEVSSEYDEVLDRIKVSFSNNGDDIYYFEENSASGFDEIYPTISVLNEKSFYIVNWQDGKLRNGTKISSCNQTMAADLLRDSVNRVDLIVNDGEDPAVGSSSSSSGISSSSTSSVSGTSGGGSSSSTEFCWISTPRDSNRNWVGVASSSNGATLVALVNTGQIYTSIDSGITWVPRDSNRFWVSAASSASGAKMVAVEQGGQIYTSTDSGVTWTPRDSNRNWVGVASSSDGVNLVAVVGSGRIYTSTDSGLNWTPRDSSRVWTDVASSADGANLAAVVYGGQIYTSTDSGLNWTPRDSNRDWWAVTSSADGAKLAAVVYGGQIYTSADSGVTWTPRDSDRAWWDITSSADGANLAAVVPSGRIYNSTDSGVTWTPRDSIRQWYGIASSVDGINLVASVASGKIYTITNNCT